ncbi:hypothetical protein N7474_009059 [Penicillium riverlandense]|uniref:uncharacterized protein n=1 Tax=Penicillium riverlandense TaxID=1903569 RepID=UPI002548825F|nr:uncharacterized protein N7474_009059 [Penicillium riverlandense]KAJ5807790.1 hypothetical protein N7474_009059 [Penicillium riverlandense]
MAQSRGDRPFSSFHNLLKMILSPSNPSTRPTHDDADLADDVDEPPDHRIHHATTMHPEDVIYTRPPIPDRKESLLTRALKSSPEMSPTDQHPPSLQDSTYMYRSYPHSNISGISTAELTSDGGLTSPSSSNTPSPPLPPQMMGKPGPILGHKELAPKVKVVDTNENTVEANLGRKRCISFACGRKTEQEPPTPAPQPEEKKDVAPEPLKRRTALTFVCPGRDLAKLRDRSPAATRKAAFRTRCRGSPAPVGRKPSPDRNDAPSTEKATEIPTPKGVPTSGLGKFEESEATRFHEFASSVEEDDEWVNKAAEYSQKITLNDCMKKEMAIRRLGEEAEEEAEEEDEDVEDAADDDSTIHDFSSDDGNESDNEAGFADSDESDDDEYEFWALSRPTADPPSPALDILSPPIERRASNTSWGSMTDDHQKWLPSPVQRIASARPAKVSKMRPATPNLPDSTDFVCGTLDEDRPLEVAYKSCLEQRRMSKHILIPQDIDPSFPTSDPEDEEDEEDWSNDDLEEVVMRREDSSRGRAEGSARKPSPRHSPKLPSPRLRTKSPSPDTSKWAEDIPLAQSPDGLNISHLVQRPPLVRTKSLPRTPNPFFTGLEKSRQGNPPWTESPERERSRTRELHMRGPVDIVEGLEKKRQKRKEKFWRQHCRKAAKEQMERRPTPGHGAERMKELGLEVAERCRAYGVGQDTQLVLSV